MKTFKLRIKDKHTDQLNHLSGSVNFVWNYVNDLGYKYLQKTGKFLSAYDLSEYTKGSGEYLGLHSQTIQAITKPTPKAVSNLKKPNYHGEPITRNLSVNRLAGFHLNILRLSTLQAMLQAKRA